MSSGSVNGGDFVHLHVHTEYSMLDGAARLDDLFARTSELGMTSIAMTDHGNVFGAYDFYSKATAAGIKPIIGMEAYLTPDTSRFEKKRVRWNDGGDDDVSGSGAYTHMTLLAETTAGMHNLFRLSSRASMEGYYYQPRADRELLAEYAAGLIGTTGCPSGEVQTWLRIGDYAKARKSAGDFQEILGRDNYFIELMDHDLVIEKRVRDGLLQLSKDLGIPVIATNDSHYVNREDAPAHEHLLCVSSGSVMSDPKRFRLDGDGYYIKSAAEMRELWEHKHGMKEACDNTLLIAERCEVSFTEGNGTYMPRFPVPAEETEETWFRREVETGLAHRYPGGVPAGGARARRLRDGRHPPDGLPGVLPRRRRLHQLGQGQRHPGRPRPRLGRRLDVRLRDADHRPRPARARPAVRALPQPRARLDARLRHRLRRAPAQRGDPLRHREVRRGPRLDDRHLRHDQGQAGGQGRQPDPRLPVRDGRPDHQGDAGRGDGQGHPAQGDLRPRAPALRRGRRVPLPLRRRPGRQDRRRHRDRDRGPQAPVGRARGRRDHVERAADRHHPADPPAPGRRDHHPVRLPDVRAPRADQDGLPGAAQPHRPRRRRQEHRAQPRRDGGRWRTSPLDDADDVRS